MLWLLRMTVPMAWRVRGRRVSQGDGPPPPSSAGSAYPDRESRLAGNPRLLPSMKPSRFFFLLLLLLEFDLCYNLPWYIDSENV